MVCTAYLQKLFRSYRTSYDLTIPYVCGGVEFAAYGHFYAHQEKYILAEEIQMWETKGYDHIFFLETEAVSAETLTEMDRVIRSIAEPGLVRGGQRYPEKNHMYSDITYVIVSSSKIKPELIKHVNRYRFSKNYLFTIRGWCDARVVAVDLAENRVYGNAKAKNLLPLYRSSLKTE